jgi:SEC-C motif domain protein
VTSPTRCPCGSGDSYADCCRRYHLGEHPATAKVLMQSRFSAFAMADAAYLLDSWHSSTRPSELVLDTQTRWLYLEIVETARGGLFDGDGLVRFRAHYRTGSSRGVLEERSTFVREDGRWRYLSGQSPR